MAHEPGAHRTSCTTQQPRLGGAALSLAPSEAEHGACPKACGPERLPSIACLGDQRPHRVRHPSPTARGAFAALPPAASDAAGTPCGLPHRRGGRPLVDPATRFRGSAGRSGGRGRPPPETTVANLLPDQEQCHGHLPADAPVAGGRATQGGPSWPTPSWRRVALRPLPPSRRWLLRPRAPCSGHFALATGDGRSGVIPLRPPSGLKSSGGMVLAPDALQRRRPPCCRPSRPTVHQLWGRRPSRRCRSV